MIAYAIISFALTLLCAYWGRTRRIGMIGAFIVSLLFTPVVGFLVAALSGKAVSNKEYIEMQDDTESYRSSTSDRAEQNTDQKEDKVDSHLYHQELEKLRMMYNEGKITSFEYEEARKRFEDLHS